MCKPSRVFSYFFSFLFVSLFLGGEIEVLNSISTFLIRRYCQEATPQKVFILTFYGGSRREVPDAVYELIGEKGHPGWSGPKNLTSNEELVVQFLDTLLR